MHVEKPTLQFLNQHDYFSQTWLLLNFSKKKRVLDIVISRKGLIPYGKIVLIDSLNIKPTNSFFFFFLQKQRAVDEKEYNSSELLYTLLKM